jgi:TonB family protein
MTRSVLLASLALSPALLHAQATSPAQTASPNVIQARFSAPAAIKPAAAPKDSPSAVRVSTGIVSPKLIKSVDIIPTPGVSAHLVSIDTTVVVTLVVDETGKPSNLAISKSGGAVLDKEVLDAVSQFRYLPGTLDGQRFALPVRLEVLVQHGGLY